MLAALESLTGELNSAHQLGRLAHRHNACKARWVPQVTILPAPGFRPGANPSQLETHSRDTRTRTSSATSQAWCADPYAISRWRSPESNRIANACKARPVPYLSSPKWTAPGSNREPSPCRGDALPVGASSPSRCGARYRTVPGCSWPIFRRTASFSRQDGACRRCSRYGLVKKQARSPAGGALQGREDSNPRRAVLEAAVLAAELRPYG
jgi:hypothetical protein